MTEPTRPSLIRPYPSVGSKTPSPVEKGDWEIILAGDLTEQETELCQKLVEVPRRSRGTIFFDSSGGSVFSGLALATMIRLRGLDPLAVVAGECSSAAILPFAACRRRFVTTHSTLLFHPMRWQSEEEVRLEEAVEWARYFQVLEDDIDSLLARMFNCDLALIREWTRPGRFVRGAEIAVAGLAEIVDLFAGDIWQQVNQKSQA